MHLKNKIWLTGLHKDDKPVIDLNPLQQKEKSIFSQRLREGVYRTLLREKCPLCASEHGILIGHKDRYGLPLKTVACDGCGLIYSLDPLDQESALRFYSDQYRALYEGTNMANSEWRQFVTGNYARTEGFGDALASFVKPGKPPTLKGLRILEIGCGGGWYLNSCKNSGAEVCGYDPDENCVLAGRERGIPIKNGLVQDALNSGEEADVVMLIHMLEHTLDPVEVLKTARHLLRDNGRLFVSVPGLKSIITGAWGGSLKYQIQGAHNYIWHREPFETMASKAGLSIENWNDSIWCVLKPSCAEFPRSRLQNGATIERLLLALRIVGVYWELLTRVFGASSSQYAFSHRLASPLARKLGLNQ